MGLFAELSGALTGYCSCMHVKLFCSKVKQKELVVKQSTVDITSYIGSAMIFWAMAGLFTCVHA